jgi:major membrane immunogen (membrane-anchored lipoprotein)
MKKLMVIAAVVFMVSCGNNKTEITCTDSTYVDSMSVSDSVGIKQIQNLDSLSKEGKI